MRAEPFNRDVPFPQSFGGDGVSRAPSRVRIVGGGLTGVLAAFQAHRLGARNIELYERFDQLGGIALPEQRGGREMREGCIYFGPEGDPIRSLLETHGARFEDFDNRFASVSAGSEGLNVIENFGGPALAGSNIDLEPIVGNSLADRLSAYDASMSKPLADYVEWHTGCDPSDLHANAALPLAINRVFPVGAPLDALSDAKRTDPLADELFGIPRSMWNYSANNQASLPVGGFGALFRQCRAALDSIGVRIHERSLATPKRMLGDETINDIVVWAASPMPLFKAVGLETPKAPARRFSTYTFDASWTGPVPFYVQNFTAKGSCFRVYIYESKGSTLLTAECVSEPRDGELIEEIHHLMAPFDGNLAIGDLQYRSSKPRWLYHSVGTIDKLGELRAELATRRGKSFVAGAWEAYAKGQKFAEVEADLRQALEVELPVEAI